MGVNRLLSARNEGLGHVLEGAFHLAETMGSKLGKYMDKTSKKRRKTSENHGNILVNHRKIVAHPGESLKKNIWKNMSKKNG